jgi:outer membrane protein assembly factor BamB
LAHRDHAYFVNQVGVVCCLDLKTGEERYAERTAGPCWASPLGAGERVYFFGKDGVTTVLKAGPNFEVLATNRLWAEEKATSEKPAKLDAKEKTPEGKEPSAEYLDPIVYGVAVVDGTFFIRTGKALYCVRARE